MMNNFITIVKFNNMNKIMKTYILNNKLIVGKCESSIQDNVGYINHIDILPKFRNKKLGSKLLKKTEDTIKNDFNVNKINILVWNKMNTDLINFYLKNNYNVVENIDTYDDGVYLYDLINVKKVV